MTSTIRFYTTKYLKKIWDHMGEQDGLYDDILIQHGGHTVNGLDLDDVYEEMNRRGEGDYVAV